jgi:hypothetical protein
VPTSLYCVTDGMVKLFVEPIRFVPKPHTNEHVLVAAADLLRPKKVRLPAASVYPRLRPPPMVPSLNMAGGLGLNKTEGGPMILAAREGRSCRFFWETSRKVG